MSEINIGDDAAFEKMINGDKPVLVDFFATWCGPCQMMAPIIEEVAKEGESKNFSVAKVDIDQIPKAAAKFNVMSVPTFILFKDGKELTRMSGAMPKELLIQKIEEGMKKE